MSSGTLAPVARNVAEGHSAEIEELGCGSTTSFRGMEIRLQSPALGADGRRAQAYGFVSLGVLVELAEQIG
jgi:hypothetical protein